MEFTPEKRKKIALWVIGVATACILIFLAVQNIHILASAANWLLTLVQPLLIGVAIALILNVPMQFMERFFWPKAKKKGLIKLRRPCAFFLSLLLIFGILFGLIRLVIPELLGAFKVIIESALGFLQQFSGMSEADIAALPMGNLLLRADWDSLLQTLQDWLKNQGGTIMNTAFGTISSVVGGIFDFFIAIVFATYLLFGKDKLKRQGGRIIRAWLPQNFGQWFIHAMKVLSENFHNFITGQSLEAVILGLLCLVGMLLLKIPFAPMVSALVGVTALIPVVGAFIGGISGAFIILTADPLKALIFVVFLVILQQVEGNLIYPRVMGTRVNLPGMWILASVTLGGGIAGPVGMLLSVPLASTAYILFKEATFKREKKLLQKQAEKNADA